MSTYSTPGERTARLLKLYGLRMAIEDEISQIETEMRDEATLLREARLNTQRSRRKVAECGTDSGYYRHLRKDKTPPCDPCRLAHNKADRLRAMRSRMTARQDGAA